jgi:hypothetical protein
MATAAEFERKAGRGEDETGRDEQREDVEACFACITGVA